MYLPSLSVCRKDDDGAVFTNSSSKIHARYFKILNFSIYIFKPRRHDNRRPGKKYKNSTNQRINIIIIQKTDIFFSYNTRRRNYHRDIIHIFIYNNNC